ncbi:MAG TPA: hypothetical protein VFQ77_14860 [Pseudonocardiaceae bacterium]|nr:hypothetical protein [Pseudonocardiaceae bacterium]
MAADSTRDSQAAKRSWVVLLYFYLVALVGLGFVIVGITMALFGAKNALFPELGLPSYAYEHEFPQDPGQFAEPTEEQLRSAKDRAVDDRRSSGLDGLLSGLIVAGVGMPVLIWHYRRGRALGTGAEKPDTPMPSAQPG